MRLLLCLLISANCFAAHFKFKYDDKVKMVKNITQQDEFFKCDTREYKIRGYTNKSNGKTSYKLITDESFSNCDNFQPESNLTKVD
jgi:hypothetical protein